MKRFFYIFASLLILAGCSDRLNVADLQQIPDGYMAVNLGIDGPMAGPKTRSYVNGTETAISTIKMLCFDSGGAYITSRDGEVTATDATHGKLTGSVPANTARIHFVANFSGLDLSSVGVGTPERTVMKSDKLSSGVTDDVRFWGYHKESSSSEMSAYLTGGNTVTLIRDRAKVTVVNSDSDIESLQWTISNGLNKGFVAAASNSDNSNPYDNTYTTSTILTEYRSSGTYTLSDAESIWAGPGADSPQFLFENANSTDPVKIIVKATYKNDGGTRYHTILLQDDDSKLYRIYRNQSFVLTILNLPSASEGISIGSDNFTEAVSTTNYSNNPYSQVAREANEVNNDQYRLAVEKVSYIFESGTTGTVKFTYTGHDGGDVSDFDGDDFDVTWEPKSDTDERPDVSPVTEAPSVSFDGSTGEGSITFNLNTITSDLKFNTLQIVAPSGLTRYVDVYSISGYEFVAEPALVDNGTRRTVANLEREVYKLTFTLPTTLIDEAYPLKVKMYTSTLMPFSDNTATAPHGSFNIVSAPTTGLTNGTSDAQWNFNATAWGYWYEYVINEPNTTGSYTIYLYERGLDYINSRTISTVGMYLEIDHFGDMTSLYANAPVYVHSVDVTFNSSDFTLNGRNATATKDNISVRLRSRSGSNVSISGNQVVISGNGNGNNSYGYIGPIESSDYEMTQVVATLSTSSYTISGTTTGWNQSGTSLTWSGEGSNSIPEFTVSGRHLGVSSIVVTYKYIGLM